MDDVQLPIGFGVHILTKSEKRLKENPQWLMINLDQDKEKKRRKEKDKREGENKQFTKKKSGAKNLFWP
jgi:hypothetical protein